MALPFLAEVRDIDNVPSGCDTNSTILDTLSERFRTILLAGTAKERETRMNKIIALAGALAIVAAACSSSADTTTTTAAATTTSTEVTTTTMAPTTTTEAPSTTTSTTEAPSDEGDSGPDVDAVRNAYDVVFSSETTYEEKAPFLDDPSGLEETVAKYQETGESMGGVAMAAKTVTINGDTADVTYDLLFGGSPTYPDLKGDAVLIDGTWKVTREMFCSLMSSARVGCPSS